MLWKVLIVIAYLLSGGEVTENFTNGKRFESYEACMTWALNSDEGSDALDGLIEHLDEEHGEDNWKGSIDCVPAGDEPDLKGAVSAPEGWGGLTVKEGTGMGKPAPKSTDHDDDEVWGGIADIFNEMTRRGGFGHMDGK